MTTHNKLRARLTATALLMLLLGAGLTEVRAQLPYVDEATQGFSMKIRISTVGAIGRVACPPFSPGNPAGCAAESLGLEYPIGARNEHLYGGGVWIGGLLDTSIAGTAPPLRLVSVSYEGWAGPLFEFYPGHARASDTSRGDSFWRATRRDSTPPPGWNAYWGSTHRFHPISDEDFYCTYTDTAVRVSQHIPMNLKVIQSSYAWQDPYADAIIIFEYRIFHYGRNIIDSAYVGYFFEADDGPISVANYFQHNFSAYIRESRTAYIHNPIDNGATPVGATLLYTGKSLDSLRYTFQWFPGPNTPADDRAKYQLMSSGDIRGDEYPQVSDTRFLFSFGPFTFFPDTPDNPDPTPVKIAIAVVSGYSPRVDHRIILQRNAARALDIYLNQGIRLPATPPSPPLRVTVGFRRVDLDWTWYPGDDVLYGRPDPVTNWDSTNQVTRRYPYRWNPPGDSLHGGRNFEAYKLWRSENPRFPDNSFVLIKQFDDPRDSFEYNTGLQYKFTDSNLVRGKTYVYSVTSKSIPNLAYQEIVVGTDSNGNPITDIAEVPVDPLESSKLVNAVRVDLPFSVSGALGKVSVVPNPYRTDKDYTLESGGYEGPAGEWDENARKVKFINLPEVCTIRIFSLAGDLIRTIDHDGRDASGFSRGDADVTLVSESNRALASGIYIFTVDSQYGSQTGKFVIIR
jgi:hypothetical protein